MEARKAFVSVTLLFDTQEQADDALEQIREWIDNADLPGLNGWDRHAKPTPEEAAKYLAAVADDIMRGII